MSVKNSWHISQLRRFSFSLKSPTSQIDYSSCIWVGNKRTFDNYSPATRKPITPSPPPGHYLRRTLDLRRYYYCWIEIYLCTVSILRRHRFFCFLTHPPHPLYTNNCKIIFYYFRAKNKKINNSFSTLMENCQTTIT